MDGKNQCNSVEAAAGCLLAGTAAQLSSAMSIDVALAAKPRLLRPRIGVAAGAATSAESHVNGHGTTSGALRQICVDTAAVRPAAGNQIPSRWESNSQPLGIVFPAAGNRCPKGCGNFIRGDRGGFPPPQKHVARPSSPAAKGRNLSQSHKNLSQCVKNLSQFHKILCRRGF